MLLVLGIALVGWTVVGQPGLAAAAGLAMLLVMLAHLRTGERRTTTYEQRMRTNKRYRKLRDARRERPFYTDFGSPSQQARPRRRSRCSANEIACARFAT